MVYIVYLSPSLFLPIFLFTFQIGSFKHNMAVPCFFTKDEKLKQPLSTFRMLRQHHGLPSSSDGKSIHLQCRLGHINPWVGKIPWRRKWQLTPVFLPGKIPWTEEPGGLQSKGSQRIGQDWVSTHKPKHTKMIKYFFLSKAQIIHMGMTQCNRGTAYRGRIGNTRRRELGLIFPASSLSRWQPAQEMQAGTFLVVQWVRLCPFQGRGYRFNPWLRN